MSWSDVRVRHLFALAISLGMLVAAFIDPHVTRGRRSWR